MDLKRIALGLLLLMGLFCQILTGCVWQEPEPVPQPLQTGGYVVTTAVLYDAESDSLRWQDTMELLEQSVLLGLETQALDVAQDYDLSSFDLVIADKTLASSVYMDDVAGELEAYTEAGGYVLLDNAFCQILPSEYLGIADTVKLEGCPLELTFPEVGNDLTGMQEVVKDFAGLYPEYYEADTLLQQDYGYGFVTDTAVPLALSGDTAIYAYHTYGDGGVLLTNDLLPNLYSLGNYSMTHREAGETAFAGTTASCNQLFYSRFAGFVAKQIYGYALNRVFGYYGSPSMAWELHYEEMTAFENNSMGIFDALCREYQQIPSYTIIRSSYWWFLRTETVTYLVNQSQKQDRHFYEMDYEESAYSSGTHIAADDAWLQINSLENAGSYFRDYPEYDYRAYPCFGDVDADGEPELLSGSADGCFYVYDDLVFSDRLHTSAARKLTDGAGNPLQVSGYSSPQLIDMTGDGQLDMISGSDDGKLWLFADGQKSMLLNTDIPGQVMPAVGDVNGDGVTDLVVGSNQGILLLYTGNADGSFSSYPVESYSKLCTNAELGQFLAPCITDWNGDGNADLVVGTFDGYLAVLTGDGKGSVAYSGFVELEEMNYKGNHNAKFGNCAVPCFYDVNGDGREDLVCGSLEYGLAYPIDSEYFPCREQLQAQIDYAKANEQYIGIHYYTNGFASREREDYELRRHKEAFASYGLSTEGVGANQHTWYTSVLDDTQSFDAQYDAGVLWNSGFASPGDPGVAPQYAAENVIVLPFFLQRQGEDTMLIQNNSVLPYADTAWSDLSGKYRMPMCVYYHCDFVYVDDGGARDYLQKVGTFQQNFSYNFVREDQMMVASAAAYDLQVQAKVSAGVLTITGTDETMGVEVEFAQGYDAGQYTTDAKVWTRRGNSLIVSVDEGVQIFTAKMPASPLRQVNLPAEISVTENGAELMFREGGMMQVVTHGACTTDSEGWTMTNWDENTVFTKYGSADTLRIQCPEEETP